MGTDLLERVDFLRLDANRGVERQRKAILGQFLTPAPIARLMASMLMGNQQHVSILDAGAGVGSLGAAAVAELCGRKKKPQQITLLAFEIDSYLAAYLKDTINLCAIQCDQNGIRFTGELVEDEFVAAIVNTGELFAEKIQSRFNCIVLNPPYRKINADSRERFLFRKLGIETSNLYTGFLAVTVQLLEPGGELVAIIPRSFCNGTYFRKFREWFLRIMELKRLHVFESRLQAFQDDDVLQENVVLHAIKRATPNKTFGKITVTSSIGPDDDMPLLREAPYSEVVRPGDREFFIHIAADGLAPHIAKRMGLFQSTLADLELSVSTGRVVDFRVKNYLRETAEKDTVPLIWPGHLERGYVAWPRSQYKKPEAIARVAALEEQLVRNEHYVLVKRFTTKEEKRRVVAAVYDANRITSAVVGFENHLNYFHKSGGGLDLTSARGLAVYLNSTLVDSYFRQFNGHTQVNATDLRNLPYPTLEQLRALGEKIGPEFPDQAEIDKLMAKEFHMTSEQDIDPVLVKNRIDEARQILKALEFPRAQSNERSALTLLALLDLTPDTPWAEADAPLRGITPMMEFFRDYYGKEYKPNTRETVRRQTVHQFLEAGLIVVNPDQPDRPVNSPKAVYQVEPAALKLFRAFGSDTWDKDLAAYLSSVETLRQKYAQERAMVRIPVSLAPGKEITLSPGGQNVLVKEIIDHFAPLFAPGGKFIYVGDTDEKFAYFDEEALSELGVTIEPHGKVPDVIIHYTEKNWLLLIEAVISHGPIDPKRQEELKQLFGDSKAGLVFVTAFLTRKAMISYLDQISWETEVWVAESHTHDSL